VCRQLCLIESSGIVHHSESPYVLLVTKCFCAFILFCWIGDVYHGEISSFTPIPTFRYIILTLRMRSLLPSLFNLNDLYECSKDLTCTSCPMVQTARMDKLTSLQPSDPTGLDADARIPINGFPREQYWNRYSVQCFCMQSNAGTRSEKCKKSHV